MRNINDPIAGAGGLLRAPENRTQLATLPLVQKGNEPRVDSRVLAQSLRNQHKNVMALIERYKEQLSCFGKVPFETEALPSGQRMRYYLLNENQAHFVVALSRNTPRVVELKARLIHAFSEARRAAELHAEYLPTYHALHDQMHVLAAGSSNEHHVHANLNRLINRAAGVATGQRTHAGVPNKAMLIAAQHLAAQAMQGAADHHEAYQRAKEALAPLALPILEGSR